MDQTQWVRWSGRSGVLGAILLGAGDMLIGGWRPLGGPDLAGLGVEELTRLTYRGAREALFVGAVLGPVAALFYAAGLTQVWLALRSAGGIAALTCGLLVFGLFVGGGGVHVAFAFLPAGLLAEEAGAAAPEVWEHLDFMLAAFSAASGVALVLGSVSFAWAVGLRETLYPRWMVLLSPILLIMTRPVAGWIPAPFGGPLYFAHFNLCWWVFFAVSTHVLLRAVRERAPRSS